LGLRKPIEWRKKPLQVLARGRQNRFAGERFPVHPLFKPTCGSMTRFVQIAAQKVKDYFARFSLFSYVIEITGQLCARRPAGA
jgi:hypothetical protein